MASNGARELPFWEDLKKVTRSVPPWGLFSLMAQRPEVPLKLPVPTTFILAPNEKLVARICTSLDGKLQMRSDSRDMPVTFEMLETNLIAAYNARTSDHQPYICVVYSMDDWQPCFVTKDNFSLLTLHLRASTGQNVSSYGREEQATAASLFPERITCVQAYVPLQEDKRFLSVFLCSPVKTLHEVHCRPYYKEARVSTYLYETRELTAGELNNPLSRSDLLAQQMAKYTAGIISCLRRHRAISLPGFVCEYVQAVDGNLYMTSVHRVSAPHVRYFPCNMPAAQQERSPRASRHMSVAASSAAHPHAHAHAHPVASPRHSTTSRDAIAAFVPPLSAGAPAAIPAGAGASAPLRANSANFVSSLRKKTPGVRKPDLVVFVEESAASAAAAAVQSKPSNGGAGAGAPVPSEKQRLAKDGSKQPVSVSVSGSLRAAKERDKDGARDTPPPKSAACSPSSHDVMSGRDKSEDDSPGASDHSAWRRSNYASLVDQAERLHAQGNFIESVRLLDQAEKAAVVYASSRQLNKQTKNSRPVGMMPNADCYRCGDFVFANLDQPGAGYTHHDWRSKIKSEALQQPDKMTRVTDFSATTKSRKTQKAGLEAALLKMEKSAQGDMADLDIFDEDDQMPRVRTMCSICLEELARDVRNQPMSRGIQAFRSIKG